MSLKGKMITGVKWTSASSIITAVLQLLQVAILARYLAPSDFGVMAIVTVVIGFSSLFMDMGISSAIIHKQNITKGQLSSLYILNIFIGILLSILVTLLAPSISSFYNEDILTELITLISVTFILSSIGNQYRVLYQKELLFNILAKVEVFSAFIGFFIAVYYAMQGSGVYALIYATIVKVTVTNVLFLIIGIKKHKPRLYFNYADIKEFIGFGMFQMGERSINYFNSEFDTILIGKLLGAESLGIYSIAKTLVMRPAQIINPIITKVTFPIMARVQNDDIRLKNIYLKTVNFLCSINSPIYIAIAMLAEPLVVLLFGDKWMQSVVLVQILSIYYIFRSCLNPIGALQLAKGRADLGFYWNLLLFIFYPVTIYIGSIFDIKGVACALLFLTITFSIPSWYFMVNPLCGAKFREYFHTLLQPIYIALFSAFFGFAIKFNIDSESLSTIVFLIVSFFVWVLLNRVTGSLIWNEFSNYILRRNGHS